MFLIFYVTATVGSSEFLKPKQKNPFPFVSYCLLHPLPISSPLNIKVESLWLRFDTFIHL